MIAAVFDGMVYLQAATSEHGPALACLELAEQQRIVLHISPAILAEVRDVLTRPKLQTRFPHLTPSRVDLFLLKLASFAIRANSVPDVGFPIRDANDLPYLQLAIASGAQFLVSRDRDLLDLQADPSFLSRFPDLRIVDPVEFLVKVRQSQPTISPSSNLGDPQ